MVSSSSLSFMLAKASSLFLKTNCAAPMTNFSPPSNSAPDHLFSELNGMIAEGERATISGVSAKCFSIAIAVSFLSESLKTSDFKATFTSSTDEFLSDTTSLTVILPVVIVPVLSRQSVSTRARVSMQYSFCTSTCFCASRMTDTAKTVDVSKIKPSGIMPTSAETVDSIELLNSPPSMK